MPCSYAFLSVRPEGEGECGVGAGGGGEQMHSQRDSRSPLTNT